MIVAIIDYGSGNLRSAAKAFERSAREAGLDVEVSVTGRAEDLRRASHVVLPGVGAFADCMGGVAALPGMIEALEDAVLTRGRPFLGICVGMQLMASEGHEHVSSRGLGWIPGHVVAMRVSDRALKIPHIGWNNIELNGFSHPILQHIPDRAHAYFVHSYHYVTEEPAHVLARVEYGEPLAAVVGRDNLVGTQFHPEKSQRIGLQIIANFLGWRP